MSGAGRGVWNSWIADREGTGGFYVDILQKDGEEVFRLAFPV